jgi:anti-anti-sigma regulatory factor
VIRINEPVAAPCDPHSPLGQWGDRQAAHYYRAQHARAVQREQQWKARALAAEKIIEQLLVLVGWGVQQSEALKGQLAWLKKQQFGRKSEATPANGLAGSPEGATESSGSAGSAETLAPGTEPVAAGGVFPTQRCRGQQPGGKGPKRQRRLDLPEQTTHHTLTEAERTCPICGKLRPESGLTYFNMDHVRDTIWDRVRAETPAPRLVVLDLSAAPLIDMHGAQMLGSLADELTATGIRVQAVEARASVRERLRSVGGDSKLGGVNRLASVADVVEDFQKKSTT